MSSDGSVTHWSEPINTSGETLSGSQVAHIDQVCDQLTVAGTHTGSFGSTSTGLVDRVLARDAAAWQRLIS